MVTQSRSTSNLYTDLGVIGYGECHILQKKLVKLRKTGLVGNIILFLEHDPVYTIGRKADISNYRGIDPVRTERGGDVTYHGPGQMVIYFIFDTRKDGKRDVGKMLHEVENSVMEASAKQGFRISIGENEPGFWLGDRKIGSLGMAMDDYVSYHGISLNYSEEPLEWFQRINPCGLNPSVMSHIPIDIKKFRTDIASWFGEKYGRFRSISKSEIEKIVNAQEITPISHISS